MEIDLKCDLCKKITTHVELGRVFYLPSDIARSAIFEEAVICPKCRKDISNQQFLLKEHEFMMLLGFGSMFLMMNESLPEHLQGAYAVHEKDYATLTRLCKSKPLLVKRFYNNKPKKRNTSQPP